MVITLLLLPPASPPGVDPGTKAAVVACSRNRVTMSTSMERAVTSTSMVKGLGFRV